MKERERERQFKTYLQRDSTTLCHWLQETLHCNTQIVDVIGFCSQYLQSNLEALSLCFVCVCICMYVCVCVSERKKNVNKITQQQHTFLHQKASDTRLYQHHSCTQTTLFSFLVFVFFPQLFPFLFYFTRHHSNSLRGRRGGRGGRGSDYKRQRRRENTRARRELVYKFILGCKRAHFLQHNCLCLFE